VNVSLVSPVFKARAVKFFLCIFMATVTPIYAGEYPVSPDWRVKKIIELGDAFADSTINVSVYRQAAILPIGTDFLTAFYGASGYVWLRRFNPEGKIVGSIKVLPRIEDRLLSDGHSVVSIGISGDGFIHLTYGAHATPSFQAKIPILDTRKTATLRAQLWSDLITYPQYYRIRESLTLFYRVDTSWFRRSWDESKAKWSLPRIVLDGTGTNSVYMDQLGVRDNHIFMSWVYRMPRKNREKVVNKGIYIASSYDAGKSWKDVLGKDLQLPIKMGAASRGINISMDARLMNQNSSWIASNGNAYLAYQSRDSNGIAQIFLAAMKPGNNKICTTTVSQNKVPYDLFGMGTLLLPLSRAEVATSETKIHVIYRKDNQLVLATTDRAAGVCGGKWRYFILPTEPLLGWEPNFDQDTYRAGRGLLLYVQPARQGKRDTAIKGVPATARIYWLTEK